MHFVAFSVNFHKYLLCSYVYYIKLMFSLLLIQEIRKGLYHITPLGEAVLGRNVDVSISLIQNGADILFKSGVSIMMEVI